MLTYRAQCAIRRYRRFILRFREHFEAIPLHLSVLITALLLLVYGIPVDPHSGDALAGGSFWGFEVHAPGFIADTFLGVCGMRRPS